MPPGQAPQRTMQRGGQRRRNQSRYGYQMKEKQQLKQMYGIREEQLRKYHKESQRATAETGPYLVSLLERRLDNALYRAGFAETRSMSRQMATHRLFTVNGRPVDVPSFRLKVGDVVAVKESKRGKALFSMIEKRLQNVAAPSWITLDPAKYEFRVTALPDADEANVGVDIRALVEYFAR